MSFVRFINNIRKCTNGLSSRGRTFSQKATAEELDGPVKYSVSPASKWKAETSRSGIKIKRLWFEPWVVLASLTTFMVYFCILREENDMDVELGRTLYSRIKGLEEVQLKMALDYNLKNNLETDSIVKRLKELRALEAQNGAKSDDQ